MHFLTSELYETEIEVPTRVIFLGLIRSLALDNRNRGVQCMRLSNCRNKSVRMSTLLTFSDEIGIPLSRIVEYMEDGMKDDELTVKFFNEDSSEYIVRESLGPALKSFGVSLTEISKNTFKCSNGVGRIKRAIKSDISLFFLLDILEKNGIPLNAFLRRLEEEAHKVIRRNGLDFKPDVTPKILLINRLDEEVVKR